MDSSDQATKDPHSCAANKAKVDLCPAGLEGQGGGKGSWHVHDEATMSMVCVLSAGTASLLACVVLSSQAFGQEVEASLSVPGQPACSAKVRGDPDPQFRFNRWIIGYSGDSSYSRSGMLTPEPVPLGIKVEDDEDEVHRWCELGCTKDLEPLPGDWSAFWSVGADQGGFVNLQGALSPSVNDGDCALYVPPQNLAPGSTRHIEIQTYVFDQYMGISSPYIRDNDMRVTFIVDVTCSIQNSYSVVIMPGTITPGSVVPTYCLNPYDPCCSLITAGKFQEDPIDGTLFGPNSMTLGEVRPFLMAAYDPDSYEIECGHAAPGCPPANEYASLEFYDSSDYDWSVQAPPPEYQPVGAGVFFFQDLPLPPGSERVRQGSRTALFAATQQGFVKIRVVMTASDGESIPSDTIVEIKKPLVVQLDMEGPYHILQDDGAGEYSAIAAWLDGNEDGDALDLIEDHRFPIASIRGNGINIHKAVFRGASFPGYQCIVRGNGPANGNGEQMYFYGIGQTDSGTGRLVARGIAGAPMASSDIAAANAVNFEERIQVYAPYPISWKLAFGNLFFVNGGTTGNRVYVCLDQIPAGVEEPRYETVYDLSCRAATGIGGPGPSSAYWAQAIDAIWAQFTDLTVAQKAIDGYNRNDGDIMYYWDANLPYISDPQNIGVGCPLTLAGMMQTRFGTCGAWARFLQATLAIHGVQSTDARVVPIDPPNDSFPVLLVHWWVLNSSGVVVRSGDNRMPDTSAGAGDISLEPMPEGYGLTIPARNFPIIAALDGVFGGNVIPDDNLPPTPLIGPGSGFYPYVLHTQVCNVLGMNAQGPGNIEPPAWFENHGILKYAGVYYDPSYGFLAMSATDHRMAAFGGVANAPNGNSLFMVSADNVASASTQSISYNE